EVARELGVNFQPNTDVSEILVEPRPGLRSRGKVVGVRFARGGGLFTETVIMNADPIYAYETLVPEQFRDRRLARDMGRLEPSCSGFVLLLGVKGDYPDLAHHNIFFSPDYRAEFDYIFDRREPAPYPTIYAACTCRSDPTQAPPGHLNLFVLVNAPALTQDADWPAWQGPYRDSILEILESRGLPGLRERIVYEQAITPLDLQERYHSWRGAIYGLASNSRRTAFRRPSNRAPGVRGLYFVGGSVHPGGGIPLVMLSARLVARQVR
ncbi:MAG: phytoene desaturase family protein, partial [Chloroflexia bacterium]